MDMDVNALDDEDIGWMIRLEKLPDDQGAVYESPAPGMKLSIKLHSEDGPDLRFFLDIHEGRRSSSLVLGLDPGRKVKMQTRFKSLALVRVDIDPHAVHRNPDGTKVRGSHVHIANDGYRGRYAVALGMDEVVGPSCDLESIGSIFERFRSYCGIDDRLRVDWSLGV